MKRTLPLMMLVLFSCTKEMQTFPGQLKSSSIDSKNKHKKNPKTISHTREYCYNNLGQGFDIIVPAFDFNTGAMVNWKITITHRISGKVTISNTLNKRNDSSINLSRYLTVSMFDQTICAIPNTVVKYLPQRVNANQTMSVPVNTSITDVINSASNNINMFQGDVGVTFPWHFDDLISAFKSNCNNTAALSDNVTVTVAYTYLQN